MLHIYIYDISRLRVNYLFLLLFFFPLSFHRIPLLRSVFLDFSVLFFISSFPSYSLLPPRSFFFLYFFLIFFSMLLVSNALQPFMSLLFIIYLFIYSSRSLSPYTINFLHLFYSYPCFFVLLYPSLFVSLFPV